MGSTKKASDQVKQIRDQFEISNHTFMNQITGALQEHVGEVVPGLKILPTGKDAGKRTISLTLMGQVTLEDETKIDEADQKVRQLMDSLKNPSNLLSLLGG